jgi:molybdate transport system substrate-binding protein
MLRVALAAALVWLSVAFPAQAQDRPVLVFAAASLRTALDEAAAAFRRERGQAVAISYAASGALARQIEQGAPADIFISADPPWMDYAVERRLVRPETRVDLLGNELVLVAPSGSGASLRLAPGADLAGLVGDGRLAIGEPRSVPAGAYARQALQALGLWAGVESRLAQADNVRAVLALVARGEARAGVVYRTDARAEPGVRVVDAFPAGAHAPIVYPAALTTASRHEGAPAFLAFLRSAPAQAIFAAQGFTRPGGSP